jgi:trehalose 6-phosphate synthase
MAPNGPVGLAVVSNRGPVSFRYDRAGGLVARRAGGGMVAALGPGVRRHGALWLSAAISDADRDAALAGVVEAEGYRVRWLLIDAAEYRMYYDVIANGSLWFLHHGLWDLPRRPRFDRRWWEAWEAYRAVNRRFAAVVADVVDDGATVLVHDYHLALVCGELAALRPDLRTTAFVHTPFCTPEEIGILPRDVGTSILAGLASAGACGFHAVRWATAFQACCEDRLGRPANTFVSPAAPDRADLARVAGSTACAAELRWLDQTVGDRRLIVRVDRIELSKNLLRGFHAFDDLLEARPALRGEVVFAAFVYPSREGLAEYLAYRQEVESTVRRINQKWATATWTPIILDTSDNHPRSVAALRRYDVLLVNPVRDGLNLVAKEGPLLNERNGVLALSPWAGAWDELGRNAIEVHPFDVADASDALASALDMPAAERAERAIALKDAASRRRPTEWFDDLLAAARPPGW